ncbi:dipeptide-binding ABC transporter, periplasmic substrate-binding component [Hydrogenimonas sp.]|nr:dipeptide-binding ABC transporter, periplasmic substrate-binding component [Hydrogenimonas sp.]
MIRLLSALLFPLFLHASTLHLSLGANPSRINPLLATDSASGEISGWIFNGVVKFDKNGSIVGDLAESWIFKTPKVVVFKLRRGVKWHDGKPFDAEDVVFTYNLLKSPKIFTPYASDFRYVESVRALDPFTLEVRYKEPYFKALSIWMMGILPKHLWEGVEDPMTSDLNRKPVGTGPYRLKSMQNSGDVILEANSDYFEHRPNIDFIHYHFMPDPTTRFLMLKAKKLDMGSLTPLQRERQLEDSFLDYYRIVQMPGRGYTYLGFNLKLPKFRDRRVREAIDMAIDKNELIKILFFSHGKVCYGPFMPGTFAFPKKSPKHTYDPERAKALLKEAGYTDKKPLEFTISTNANNSTRLYAAQIIQYQLARIGVRVKIRAMEWQAFLNTVVTPRRFEVILLGWSLGLIPDAYALWHSDSDKLGGFNLVGYRNERVDRMIERAEKLTDLERVGEIYRKMFNIIAEERPYIFLYIPDSITAVNRKITPIVPSIIGIMHNQIDWIKP